jgi:acyl-CoA synthetase (AMP-forming)/AMP-acid ligase II
MLRTIREYLDFQAAERPDAIYLLAPETGRTMTFLALQKASRRLAAYLSGCGGSPGDRIALLMENGYQTCRLFIGSMYAGYCVTPLNLLAQTSQLEYVLGHSDAKIVFVTPDQQERLMMALKNVPREVQVQVVDVDAEEFIIGNEEKADLAPVGEADDALMMYTSGTTGKPKGVVLTNCSVVSGGQFVSEAHALTPQDRVMACLPLYHINAQIVTATAPLVHGGSLVLPHRFGVSAYWGMVEKYRCTWINLVPTMISYLVNVAEQKEMTADLSRVRFCRSASAPLPPSQHRAFEERFKIGVIETMGLTETAAPCFTNPLDPAQRKIGSPGRAFGNEAKIIGLEGKPLPAGETGEIMIRGANVMKCYYKSPEQTASAFTEDGWLHTGDLGYLDEDGFVFVTGRIKELIIKGGENIAPREIDEALLKHPAVLDAAAVGIPDQNYGQEIMACIVLKEGARCTVEELRTFCENELGRYKTPKIFHFVEDLPRGPSGKVQRLKLLDAAPTAEAGASGSSGAGCQPAFAGQQAASAAN